MGKQDEGGATPPIDPNRPGPWNEALKHLRIWAARLDLRVASDDDEPLDQRSSAEETV